MALRYSMALRNAALDARIAAVGPNPILKINDATGRELVVIRLPAVWISKASKAFVTKQGDWQGHAKVDGKPNTFRICDQHDTCHIEGGIPGELTLDKKAHEVFEGQLVMVDAFTIRSGNG